MTNPNDDTVELPIKTETTSDSDNPVKIYMREISLESLLTPQEEVRLAAIIRKGQKASAELEKLTRTSPAKSKNKKNTTRAKATPRPASSKDRIQKLKAAIAAGQQARQKMIRANLRLVVKIAQDYAGYGLPLLDLISEGNIGLMRAVDRFEPSKGAKLSTYAAWWIKQAVKRALANQGKTIRLPVHLTDKISRLRRISTQLSEEFGREPTDEELAEELGISPAKVSQLRSAAIRPASLNATVGDSDGSELGELVSDESARTPDELVENLDITRNVLSFLDILDARERKILTLRYGLDGNRALTLEEVGEQFNVTRERIRQLQNIALRKIRRAIERKDNQGVRDYLSDTAEIDRLEA
jgi:RNA polymerase primary sigma factor